MRQTLLNVRNLHFLGTLILLMAAVHGQSWLARSNSPWWHLDLVTLLVVYTAVEHFFASALIKIMIAAFLLQGLSAAPSGFFLMYYAMVFAFSTLLGKLLVLHNFSSQLLTFTLILMAKYVLLWFSLTHHNPSIVFSDFLQNQWQGFLLTSLLSVPTFALCARLDAIFEYFPMSRDSRQDSRP